MKKNYTLLFLLLCCMYTGCTDVVQPTEGPININIKDCFGISGHQRFSCILDSGMHNLYVINADTLYHYHTASKVTTKQPLGRIIPSTDHGLLLHRLVYYELSPAILSYYHAKTGGIDSLLYISPIQHGDKVNKHIPITIKNNINLKDQYLVTGAKYITLLNKDSLIVSCNQSVNYVINRKMVRDYKGINGNIHILDPYKKQVISFKKCPPAKPDCYMYNESLRDTVLVRSNDSIFSKFDYMGNSLIVNSTIF